MNAIFHLSDTTTVAIDLPDEDALMVALSDRFASFVQPDGSTVMLNRDLIVRIDLPAEPDPS